MGGLGWGKGRGGKEKEEQRKEQRNGEIRRPKKLYKGLGQNSMTKKCTTAWSVRERGKQGSGPKGDDVLLNTRENFPSDHQSIHLSIWPGLAGPERAWQSLAGPARA